MKASQDPSVLTRSGHHTAEGHRGISKVLISPPADMCFKTRGIRYRGGKIQLFSFNQEIVNASTASHLGLRYLLQNLSSCLGCKLAKRSTV